jgi:vWA-MoxR associated protein C-terminal domain
MEMVRKLVSAEFTEMAEMLAQLLSEIPALKDEQSCHVLMDMMVQRGYDLPDLASRTMEFAYCYRVIKAAAGQAGALTQLATSVWRVDRTPATKRFQKEVDRLLPSEIFTLMERIEFISFVRDAVLPANLNHYYRLAAGDLLTKNLQTAEDLVSELEEKLIPGVGHPIIRLTEAIAGGVDRRATAKHARAWSDQIAKRIDEISHGGQQSERKWLERFREYGSSRAPVRSERVTLVQVIEPSGPRVDRFLYRVFMYHGEPEPVSVHVSDTPQSLDDVQRLAMNVLRKVIERFRRPEGSVDIELEFFLPRRLLSYPVEEWSISPYNSLGAHYVVVVRDWDRFQEPILWPGWQRKWASFEEDNVYDADTPEAVLRKWVTCSDVPFGPGVLTRELRADELFSLGLTFPPLPGGQHIDLAEALDSGTAIVVWPRRPCIHAMGVQSGGEGCNGNFFRQDISHRLAGRRLADLPRIIWEMRKEQLPLNGLGAVLLWDNPAHWPGVSEFHLDWPHPVEEE